MKKTKRCTIRSFTVESDPDILPFETTSHARRLKLSWHDKPIMALNQGLRRAYLYPLFTPAGIAVTAEAPVDHPHHQSVAVMTDDFIKYEVDELGNVWESWYNFYQDETSRGRAPGRIVATSTECTEIAGDHLRIVQAIRWQGPPEWASSDGFILARETRTIDVYPGEVANIVDIRSQLQPTEWDIQIGGTVHGYFVIRMADGLRAVDGGKLVDSVGRVGAKEIRGRTADWVDCSGKAAYGNRAGLAVFPYAPAGEVPWHLSDWGFTMVNPFQVEARKVNRGEMAESAIRLVAHDGDATEAQVQSLYQSFASQKV